MAHSFLSVEKDDESVFPKIDRLPGNQKCHTGDADFCNAGYSNFPKIATLFTFGISSVWGLLLLGARYFLRAENVKAFVVSVV